jgi:hypothetical protein
VSAILISFLVSLIISLVTASPITDHTSTITNVLPRNATEVKERDNSYYVNIVSQNGLLKSIFEACFQAENPSLQCHSIH